MDKFEYKKVPEISDFKELLYYVSEKYGDDDAFRFKDSEGVTARSYIDLSNDVAAFATALHENGFGGKHIAVIGETSYDWVVSYLSIVLAGSVAVPIDKELPEGEIISILRQSGAAGIIYSKSFERLVKKLPPEVFALRMSDETEGSEKNTEDYIIEGYELICRGNGYFASHTPDPEKTAALLFTSGTTGVAKGIRLSQKNIVQVPMGLLAILDMPKSTMSVLPVHHSYEFSVGILTSLMNGTTICINDSLRYFMENLKLYKPEMMFVVPMFVTMMKRRILEYAKQHGGEAEFYAKIEQSNALLKKGEDKRAEIFREYHELLGGRLSLIVTGGAPLAAGMMKFFREIGLPLLNGYGITECAPLVSCNNNTHYLDDSVGLHIGCCVLDVRNADENGVGEIWVKGANVMKGYYNNEEATREVMDGEWFNTGDLGFMQDGFLFITGRAKNLIILDNGKNVYPEEIEDKLLSLPGISEVVVYQKQKSGGVITAQVFPSDNFDFGGADKQEYIEKEIAALNKTQPVFKQVRRVELRDKPFAKTTTNKIKRASVEDK